MAGDGNNTAGDISFRNRNWSFQHGTGGPAVGIGEQDGAR